VRFVPSDHETPLPAPLSLHTVDDRSRILHCPVPNTLCHRLVGIACSVVFVAERRDTDAFIAPTFGQRLGGRGLDALFLVPVLLLFTVSLNGTAYRVAGFVLVATYDIGGVAIWGQTIGKRLLGTKVVNITDEPLRPWQAVARFSTYGVPTLVFTAVGLRTGADLWSLIVFAPILRPPWHRGLHDVTARTIVVPASTELGRIR
jgi:uncharacterized RDD family membrane protein YckC